MALVSSVTQVVWTQFPAEAIQADWTNPADAHRAVMALFARTLAGSADERRAHSQVLYRLDNLDGILTVFVQSAVVPEKIPPAARMMTVTDAAWQTGLGDRVMFRVAVNPVTRRTVKSTQPDGTVARSTVTGVVGPDDLLPWLTTRFGGALDEVTMLDHFRDTFTLREGRARRKLVVDTVDAVGIVTDPAAFDRLRREGVGRSRAYGCGLLTARGVG